MRTNQPPDPEAQVQFLFKVQRLLSEGGFVATYKYALLLSLAELAVERGNDDTERLDLDTLDLAEKFVELYWRQVAPWVPQARAGVRPGPLHQITGGNAAILRAVSEAHERFGGSLTDLRRDRRAWQRLLARVAQTIEVMPLWKLQTVGQERLDFLYPNVGRSDRISLRGDAVYCLRRFYELIGDLARAAWVRFVRELPRNRDLLGESCDLWAFLFGSDRTVLARFRPVLRDLQDDRCFYCEKPLRAAEPAVDHFIPWARYPLDVGENLVLADGRCNGWKSDKLAGHEHLARWRERNAGVGLACALASAGLPQAPVAVDRVALWAYSQAEKTGGQAWLGGRDGLGPLDPSWRTRPFPWVSRADAVGRSEG